MRVDVTHLVSIMKFLSEIERAPLADIVWLDNGKVVPVTEEQIKDWKFTGLNNRDFALFHLDEHSSSTYKNEE